MQFANTGQLKAIHTILGKMGFDGDKEYKQNLVIEFSNGRATSSKDLYYREAEMLIEHLNKATGKTEDDIKADRMRKKIIGIARSKGWELDGKADIQRIDGWCRKYGTGHKGFNEYTVKELPALVTQFEKALNGN